MSLMSHGYYLQGCCATQDWPVAREALMRTTLDIRDDVLQQVKEYAAARSMPAGAAASYLLQQALNRPLGTRIENGFEVFDVPGDSPVVTLEHTLRLEDEL
jgi:hypothetical protein